MPSFDYRSITKRLKKLGFYFWRQGKGAHELWKNPQTEKTVLISHHKGKNIPTGTVAIIAKSVGFRNLKDFENFQ